LEMSASDRNYTTDRKTGARTLESGPDWKGTQENAAANGYKVDVFGSNELTGNTGPPRMGSANDFESALKNSEVVLYVGHGFGDASGAQFHPGAIGVGLNYYTGEGMYSGETGQMTAKPDASAAVVCNFSCNSVESSSYFNNTSKGFQITLAIEGGKDGYTNVGTLEKAANAFINAYTQAKGSARERWEAGAKAAQGAIDTSRARKDKDDRVVIYELRLAP
jgi:hypothetical protein